MNKKTQWSLGVGLLALAGAAGYRERRAVADGVAAETPMIYAGLLEEAGAPVTGDRMVRIVLWDHATEITSPHRKCETLPDTKVAFAAGRFQVPLDNACTNAVHANPNLWIEIFIEAESMGRSKLGAVPYALEAGRATAAAGPLRVELDALSTRDVVTNPTTNRQIRIDGSYCGVTAPQTGNLGGYPSAKALCETQCGQPTAHVCTTNELLRGLSLGDVVPNGRVNGGESAGYGTGNVLNDCTGWTTITGTSASVEHSSLGAPFFSVAACSTSAGFLCCD